MFSRKTTRGATAAAVVMAVAALSTPAAQAAGPATAVTKTSLTQYDSYDSTSRYGTTNKRSISGTATGLTTPSVDVVCINPATGLIDRWLSRNVTVTAGKWSTSIWTSDLSGYRCRVAAVENNASPAGETDAARLTWGKSFTSLAPFYQIFERYDYYYVVGGGSPLKVINFSGYMYSATPSSEVTLYGSDQGGIYRFLPRNAAGSTDYGAFGAYYGSARLAAYDPYVSGATGSNVAGLTVDNAQAFTNYSLNAYSDQYSAANSVKTTYKVDKGVLTKTDVMPLFKCTNPVAADGPYSGASSCPDSLVTKLGVSWTQTQTVNAAGNTIKVVNTFTSLDKKAHTVKLVSQDRLVGGGAYRYGTSGAFGDFNGESRTNVTGYAVKEDNSKTTAFDNSIGQVVFGSKATTWATSGWRGIDFFAQFSVSIKAGKSANINIGYTLITDDTKAASQISNALK